MCVSVPPSFTLCFGFCRNAGNSPNNLFLKIDLEAPVLKNTKVSSIRNVWSTTVSGILESTVLEYPEYCSVHSTQYVYNVLSTGVFGIL